MEKPDRPNFLDNFQLLSSPIEVAKSVIKAIQTAIVSECVGRSVPLHMSDHYHPEHFRGASEMLDSYLIEPPERLGEE